VINNLAYFELMPQYVCSATDKPCVPEDFCPDLTAASVDWSSEKSLHNWVEKLDLTCETSARIGLIGSVVFFGWTLASLILPRLADIHGRRKPYLLIMVFQALILALLISSQSLVLTTLLMFFLGLCAVGRYTFAYIYLIEFMTE